jgi:hypothetical protein
LIVGHTRKSFESQRDGTEIVDDDVKTTVFLGFGNQCLWTAWRGQINRHGVDCPTFGEGPELAPTSRAPAITRAPSATNAFVTARPMPLLAPVTTATLLFNPRSTAVSFDRHLSRSVTSSVP